MLVFSLLLGLLDYSFTREIYQKLTVQADSGGEGGGGGGEAAVGGLRAQPPLPRSGADSAITALLGASPAASCLLWPPEVCDWEIIDPAPHLVPAPMEACLLAAQKAFSFVQRNHTRHQRALHTDHQVRNSGWYNGNGARSHTPLAHYRACHGHESHTAPTNVRTEAQGQDPGAVESDGEWEGQGW